MTGKLKRKLLALVFAGLIGSMDELNAQPFNNLEPSLFGKEKSELVFSSDLNMKKELKQTVSTLRIFMSKFDFSFNYIQSKESEKESNYLFSRLFYVCPYYSINDPLYPKTAPFLKQKIFTLYKSLKGGYADYSYLTSNFSCLPESSKFFFLNTIGLLLGSQFSKGSNPNAKFISQEELFDKISLYWKTGENSDLGACKQIAYYISKTAEDIGMDATTVTGKGERGDSHAYVLLRLPKDRLAIIDYNKLFISQTKDVDKALRQYGEDINSLAFHHSFFEGNTFKYRFVNKDGENFLDFVGFDMSLNGLKKNSLEKKVNFNKDTVRIRFDKTENFSAIDFQFYGVSAKTGQIIGDFNSPLKKMELAKIGLQGVVPLNSSLVFSYKGDILGGVYVYKHESDLTNNLFGADLNLKINLDYFGLNLTSELKGIVVYPGTSSNPSTFFNHLFLNMGISYPVEVNYNIFNPYVLMQGTLFYKDLQSGTYTPALSELRGGIEGKIPLFGDISLGLDAYLGWKPWEYDGGAGIKFGNKRASLEAEISANHPTYWACPKKMNIGVKGNVAIGRFEGNIGYNYDSTDYSGEISVKDSLSAGLKIKF